MAVADMGAEIVLVDHFAEVLEDLIGRGDRHTGPRLEAVAEGVEVAVGANARVAVHPPGAAEAIEPLQHYEACAGALFRQVVGPADA